MIFGALRTITGTVGYLCSITHFEAICLKSAAYTSAMLGARGKIKIGTEADAMHSILPIFHCRRSSSSLLSPPAIYMSA